MRHCLELLYGTGDVLLMRAQARGCLPMASSPFDAALPQFAAVAANLSVLSNGCRPPPRASGAHGRQPAGQRMVALADSWDQLAQELCSQRAASFRMKQTCLHDSQSDIMAMPDCVRLQLA